jgi:hypothetical protein
VVTELTKDSITIRGPGEEPKRFPVSETLAAGKIPKEPRPIPGRRTPYVVSHVDMYRLTDVKVGDWVTIMYSQIGGVVTCDHICIRKRSGGRVPPLPDGVETSPGPQAYLRYDGVIVPREWIRYHEYMNAYWNLEDKGIAYPEKFGDRRRFPAAPPPRAVPVAVPVLTIPVPTREELTKLAETYGPWTDPDKDCGFRLAGGAFKVALPGREHLLQGPRIPRVQNAPRAVREVEGDFTAVVRVAIPVPDWLPKARWPYCSGGLAAWGSDGRFFVHRLAGGNVFNHPEAIWAEQEKEFTTSWFFEPLDKPMGTAYLRLKREGKTLTAGWSRDGKTWEEFEPQELAWGAKVKVGVVAENSLWVPVEITFDQYQLTQPRKK